MAKALALTLSADQVTSLLASLPDAARQQGSGIAYADGILTVPSQFSAAATAAMKKPGWDAPPDPKIALLAYAADKRWHIEVGGITVDGHPVATDDRSKIMIMGARAAAAADAAWSTLWRGTDGETFPVSAAQMLAISSAVEAHVSATFATFAGVKAGIASGAIADFSAVDRAFGT